MKQFKSIQVGDIVMKAGRVWKVVGIYLGCNEQENLIGLETMDLHAGCVGGVGVIKEMHVPEDLIDHACIFRRVDHEAAKAGPKLAASR